MTKRNETHIRNFCVIAHIDHGKSTICDRILEMTHTVDARDITKQMLDQMDIEQERGITIKSNAVRVMYEADNGETYEFNLIDTPGHVDFSYEVSRSLAACEGAILVVDATQGVEAQTVSNALYAMNANLEIVVALNKIDLKSADIEVTKAQVEDLLSIPADDAVPVSGKSGEGIHELLEQVVHKIPHPKGDSEKPLQALIIDSWFDSFRGVVALACLFDGQIQKGDAGLLMAQACPFTTEEVGIRTPQDIPLSKLSAGDVGYIVTGLKDPTKVTPGDTITLAEKPALHPCPGYRESKPFVFSGLFPIETDEYENLRDALNKLSLNDPAITYEPETSLALGFGFRVGLLGLLHLEVVKERIEREYNISLIATTPSVDYKILMNNESIVEITNPDEFPDPGSFISIEEPMLALSIIVPAEYVGAVMDLTIDHRGVFKNMVYLNETTVEMHFDMPLAELILAYFDQLKTRTKGYASLDYELKGYQEADLVKLDILLAGEPVDALSCIIARTKAYERGREICDKLKELIPRQLFEVPIQAAIGGKIIARSTVKARRKDVLAKCYGGDITRKRKLLEKQKAGKKRMKAIGKVEVPQEAFLAFLQNDVSK